MLVAGASLPSHSERSNRATPKQATPQAGITPWPPRHAQSGIRFHVYALISVNFDSVLQHIAGSRPLLRLEAQSRRESFAHERNPGKVAFANLTPIKVFQPKWHIFFVDC